MLRSPGYCLLLASIEELPVMILSSHAAALPRFTSREHVCACDKVGPSSSRWQPSKGPRLCFALTRRLVVQVITCQAVVGNAESLGSLEHETAAASSGEGRNSLVVLTV